MPKKLMRDRRYYIGCASILFMIAGLSIPAGTLSAQSEQGFTIRWISQFPAEGGSEKRTVGERLGKLLFGERSLTLVKPFGVVAVDPQDFWILDQGAGTIVRVANGKGKLNRSLDHSGKGFPSLVGFCFGEDGELYYTDSRLNCVGRVSEDAAIFNTDSMLLMQPTGIAFSGATGQIWVVETAAHRIAIFDRDGTLVRRIGTRGSGPGTYNFPTFIWIDREGKVYIVDSMNFRIQILDQRGEFLACFGENGDASGQLARPKGVATDSHGNIYVADALFHVVQIFDPEGKFLYSFGGQGQGEGEFWMPAGIYIDSEDHIFVADSYNSRVQVFKLVKQ
jgi:DNA-binding beta-propeller fold protein YncE